MNVIRSDLADSLAKEFTKLDSTVIAALVGEIPEDNCTEQHLLTLRSTLTLLNNETQSVPHVQDNFLRDPKEQQNPRKTTDEEENERSIIEKYGHKTLELCRMFPDQSAWLISRKLRECGEDMDKAIDAILDVSFLNTLDESERFANMNNGKKKKHKKSNKASPPTVEDDLEFLERAFRLDSEQALELYNKHGRSVPKILEAQNILSLNWSKYKPTDQASSSTTIASSSRSSAPLRQSASLSRASENYEKARMFHVKAKSNPLFHGAAHYYATEAHGERSSVYQDLIRSQTTPDSVDYHGIPLHFAVESCAKLLREKKLEGRSNFTIITGSGQHSINNVPRIKNAIRRYLNENNYSYNEGAADFLVKLR